MEPLSLSPLGLFLQAGPVVKIVMASLLAASIWCWYVIAAALVSLRRLSRALETTDTGADDALLGPILRPEIGVSLVEESVTERYAHVRTEMRRAARRLLSAAQGGLPNLAVIASVAPFVGLFGTVWGIMTAFAGIAEAKEAGLAVVAPGIAEALAATAYGLAAAIPAAIGYNRLGAAFAARGEELGDLIDSRASRLVRQKPTAAGDRP
jgi:biopolymer transport protein ExbB/TolQ